MKTQSNVSPMKNVVYFKNFRNYSNIDNSDKIKISGGKMVTIQNIIKKPAQIFSPSLTKSSVNVTKGNGLENLSFGKKKPNIKISF